MKLYQNNFFSGAKIYLRFNKKQTDFQENLVKDFGLKDAKLDVGEADINEIRIEKFPSKKN